MEYKFAVMLKHKNGKISTTHIIITYDGRPMFYLWWRALTEAWKVAREENAELVQITHWI